VDEARARGGRDGRPPGRCMCSRAAVMRRMSHARRWNYRGVLVDWLEKSLIGRGL